MPLIPAFFRELPMAMSDRPLSPHLQIWRWNVTMALSIVHRATGVGLGLGALMLAWWLIAAASGPEAFATAQGFMGSILGRLILLGFTAALFFHLCNGIRHLVWDMGYGFEVATAERSAWFTIAATVVLTLIAWIAGYAMRGA
jgi:succinate dehydrogenase / fumarate reductase cytochrome b subunit